MSRRSGLLGNLNMGVLCFLRRAYGMFFRIIGLLLGYSCLFWACICCSSVGLRLKLQSLLLVLLSYLLSLGRYLHYLSVLTPQLL